MSVYTRAAVIEGMPKLLLWRAQPNLSVDAELSLRDLHPRVSERTLLDGTLQPAP